MLQLSRNRTQGYRLRVTSEIRRGKGKRITQVDLLSVELGKTIEGSAMRLTTHVDVRGDNGATTTLALVDSGAVMNVISLSLSKRLRLKVDQDVLLIAQSIGGYTIPVLGLA